MGLYNLFIFFFGGFIQFKEENLKGTRSSQIL